MTKSEIFDLMLRCNGPQLDAITTKLQLKPAYLPGPGEAVATRASAILELCEQQDLLGELEAALLELFPRKPGFGDNRRKEKRILILAANPVETERLRIDEEVRLIKQRLQESDPGREYRVESEWAVRITELSKFLMDHEPVIVHFSAHGSPTGQIVLQDEHGRAAPLAVNVLANLFDILKGPTECVVLNACYSIEQARALANYVGCVVGWPFSTKGPRGFQFRGPPRSERSDESLSTLILRCFSIPFSP